MHVGHDADPAPFGQLIVAHPSYLSSLEIVSVLRVIHLDQ